MSATPESWTEDVDAFLSGLAEFADDLKEPDWMADVSPEMLVSWIGHGREGAAILRELLREIEQALTGKIDKGATVESDEFRAEVNNRVERSRWDRAALTDDVRHRILYDKTTGTQVSGETVFERLTKLQPLCASAPSVRALRDLGLDPGEYCTENGVTYPNLRATVKRR